MASQKQNFKWDAVNQVFEAPIFNLKWDLSELGDWRIANTEQLPENMIFCGGYSVRTVGKSFGMKVKVSQVV